MIRADKSVGEENSVKIQNTTESNSCGDDVNNSVYSKFDSLSLTKSSFRPAQEVNRGRPPNSRKGPEEGEHRGLS